MRAGRQEHRVRITFSHKQLPMRDGTNHLIDSHSSWKNDWRDAGCPQSQSLSKSEQPDDKSQPLVLLAMQLRQLGAVLRLSGRKAIIRLEQPLDAPCPKGVDGVVGVTDAREVRHFP